LKHALFLLRHRIETALGGEHVLELVPHRHRKNVWVARCKTCGAYLLRPRRHDEGRGAASGVAGDGGAAGGAAVTLLGWLLLWLAVSVVAALFFGAFFRAGRGE